MTRWTGGRDRVAALQEMPPATNTPEERAQAAAYIGKHGRDEQDAALLRETLGLDVS